MSASLESAPADFWAALERLRGRFLDSQPGAGSYWGGPEDLAAYHATFAQRIRWKWEAVLDELQLRQRSPPPLPVYDWGCGTGIAGWTWLQRSPPGYFPSIHPWDLSSAAVQFARQALEESGRVDRVQPLPPGGTPAPPDTPFILLVSHVWNELDNRGQALLRTWIRAASVVVWVEPGTHGVARALQSVRDECLGTHDVLAPCTHARPCPGLAPGHESDWCHHFAHPPSDHFQDPGWARFGRMLGIDLRSLPYAFLVLERRGDPTPTGSCHPSGSNDPMWGMERGLGRPRILKPCIQWECCGPGGIHTREISKRHSPEAYRAARKGRLGNFLRLDKGLAFPVSIGLAEDTMTSSDTPDTPASAHSSPNPAPHPTPPTDFTGRVTLRPGFQGARGLRHVLFDFDGTLSLIRQGWPDIMVPLFVEVLPPLPGETEEQRRQLVWDDIMRLNGKQTIYQMMQLADRIRERGGTPKDPLEYKHEYLRRLDARITDRHAALKDGSAPADAYLVHGSRALLERLQALGLTLYLASGTDEPFVRAEADLLDITRYFGNRIYGAQDDFRKFSKKMVIERILRENQVPGDALLAFGDGYVEIENTKQAGGVAVAVASDEARNGSGEFDAWKHERLMGVGADLCIPDYRDLQPLLRLLGLA